MDPTATLPEDMTAVNVGENRPNYGTQQWNKDTHRLDETPALPTATIVVYGDDKTKPQNQFDVGDAVNIGITFSAQLNRSIAVPVDRLDAEGNVIEPAALWFNLTVANGVGTISKVFNTPGRYGVGSRSSQEFSVPETIITVFA